MAWDSSRPIPWQRLVREWVFYALIMAGILLLLVRDNVLGAMAGVLISGPLYLTIGAILAKFGYQRKTMAEMRAEREATKEAAREAAKADQRGGARSRPAATSRTSGGSNRPRSKRRR